MSLIFVFIDGIGLGFEERSNPFYTSNTPFLDSLLEGRSLTREALGKKYAAVSLLGLDALLGVKGLPQSATGQTSLFTGVNAASAIGRHLRGFPNRALRDILARDGIFLRLGAGSFKSTFANAYRPGFFKDLEKGPLGNFSCSTLITLYGGLSFRSLNDLRDGQAVYMDITNTSLPEMGFQVPLISPREAGKRLVSISRNYDFTLYEHFITDIAGHSGDYRLATKTVELLDAFLGSVAENIDPENDLVLVCSDHGNLENMDSRTHTINPVPALVIGHKRHRLVSPLAKKGDITGVVPALLEALAESKG